MGRGVAVKELELGWWRVIKGSFQNILKQGWVKAKAVRRGGGLKVTPPLPPPSEKC